MNQFSVLDDAVLGGVMGGCLANATNGDAMGSPLGILGCFTD